MHLSRYFQLKLIVRWIFRDAKKPDSIHSLSIPTIKYTLPVTAKQIAKQSAKDSTVGSALAAVQQGSWAAVVSKELLPFYRRRTKLSIIDGCLLWGCWVVIPQKLQKSLLSELHSNHIGVSKIKLLARSYIWWPHIDTEIEAMAKTVRVAC